MKVRLASAAAPDRPTNEDHAFAVGNLVGVLDGVTQPPGMDTGCIHDPAWYVQHLAAHLAQGHTADPHAKLSHLLATAIEAVRDDHGGSCDLSNPATPAATVCLLRCDDDEYEYLMLSDATLVLDYGDHLEMKTDGRFRALVARIRTVALVPGGLSSDEPGVPRNQVTTSKYQYLNQQGGYWIAAADPRAAHEAVTGSVAITGPGRPRRALLLTDGASSAVDEYGLFGWPTALNVAAEQGPDRFIERVRAAELGDSSGLAVPRFKRHDDASLALCTFD
jgi:hypothetical protein